MNALANGHIPSDALGAAKYYLGRGLVPVPVPRTGRCKAPVLLGWPDLRPTLDDLAGLFPEVQATNVGILLGNASGGLIDIDLDAFEAVAAAPFLLPVTGWLSGRSGKQFSHWWYTVADPPDKAQDKFSDLDGTDLLEFRSTGGQTVAPPSVHETGELIVWHKFEEPAKVDCMQLLAAAKAIAAAAILARHWPKLGTRQDAFLALAGALLRAGWAEDRIERFADAIAAATDDEESRKRTKTVAQTARKQQNSKNTTGWPRLAMLLGSDGEHVIARVREWLGLSANNAKDPGKWPDPVPLGEMPKAPPFPIDVLPLPFRQLVDETAWAMNCPTDYVGIPLLVLAGGALANSRHLSITSTHMQAPCLYAAYVGRPGTTKSAPLKLLRRPFDKIQAGWLEDWRREMDAWEEDESDERGPKPIVKRCIVSDITTESLGIILNENVRGVLMIRNELTALVAGLNQYKSGKGHDRQVYLNLWDGDTIIIDRKSDKSLMGAPLYVRDPFTSIIGTLQPDVLSRLRGEAVRGQPPPDDGFLDRFLIVYPEELPAVGERWRIVSELVLATWQNTIERLLALSMVDQDEERSRPFFVHLTNCGRKAWERFTEAHACEINATGFPAHLLGPWAKLKGYCARLALILHFLRWVTGEVTSENVDGESMDRAVTLINYFKGHARKVYDAIDADSSLAGARHVARWITARKITQFTKREAFEGLKGTFKRVEFLDPALETLEKYGIVRPVPTADHSGPGRKPSPVFDVHPSVLTGASHNSHNSQNECGQPDSANCANTAKGDSEVTDDPERDAVPDDNGPGTDPRPPLPGPIFSSGHCGSLNGEHDCVETRCATDIEPNPDKLLSSDPSSPDQAVASASVMQTPYLLVTDTAGLGMVAAALDNTSLVGLDIETTGLNPRTDRVRLLSLALDTIDGGSFNYLIDCFCIDPAPLWELLADKELVIHNAQFDLGFMDRLGFTARNRVHDTMLMAQVLAAGTNDKASLAACTERYLSRALDKVEQLSNWAGILTAEQLAYAAADIDVLKPLYSALRDSVTVGKLEQATDVESRCLPAIIWMSAKGVALDRETWTGLSRSAGEEATTLRAELDAVAPQAPGQMFDGWNWDSPAQVQQALEVVGCKVDSTADWRLASLDHPLAALLRRYRLASKRATTYGVDWLKHVTADGRVYPHWFQIGAWSGRMSCSTPNMQQMPRGDYRRCVIAPPGRVLIKADYSQIELRLAAKIANEPVMIEAYLRGDDLHTLTARQLLNKDEVAKSDRQLAKALNFGLLYGMGARGLRGYARTAYGVELTEEQAVEYRAKFFRTYPMLAAWHKRVGRTKEQLVETWTVAGRRRLSVKHFTEKLNTPVQGSGADGLKLALALLWERRDQAPGSFPIMAVHDEIVVEADANRAVEAETWLKSAMIDAMSPLAKPVPVEVEVAIGGSWGV